MHSHRASLLLIALATVVAGAAACFKATANDSVVYPLPSGGLAFEKNNDVLMLSEKLKISLDEIDVRYVFKNMSSRDVTLKVGFPLPLRNMAEHWKNPHDQAFNVWVDGKNIAANVDIRAVKIHETTETDITDELKAIGLTPLDGSPTGKKAEELRKLNDKLDMDCQREEIQLPSCWMIKKTYFWDQVFPAGQEVHVRHTYQPWMGWFFAPASIDEVEKYCFDEAFYKAFWKSDRRPTPMEAEVEYILKTGANWAGPIGDFTLEISKTHGELVSFCPIPGLNMVHSGNSFIGSAKNFTPTSDLAIYFVGKNVRFEQFYDQ